MHIINQNMFVNFAPQSFLVHGNMFGLPFYSVTKCLNYTPSSSWGLHFKKSSGITVSLSEMTLSDPLFWSFENRGFHHCLGVAGCQNPMVFQWGFDHRFSPTCPGMPPPPLPFKKAKERPRQPGFFGGFRTVSELPGWKNNTLLETSPVQFNRNCNLPIFPMALRVLIQKEMKFHSSIGNASFRICASKGHCTNLI